MHETVINQELMERSGQSNCKEAVSQIVSEFISRANADFPDSTSKLDALRKLFRIVSVEVRDLPCDGLLIPLPNDTYKVYLSKDSSKERRRFSFAHELGHIFLHKLFPETRSYEARNLFFQPGAKAEELACDAFAAELLVPQNEYKEYISGNELSLKFLRNTCAQYGVSLSMAARRYKEISGDSLFAIAKISRRVCATKLSIIIDHPFVNLPVSKISSKSEVIIGHDKMENNFYAGWAWLRQCNRRRRFYIESSWGENGNGIALLHCNRDLGQEQSVARP